MGDELTTVTTEIQELKISIRSTVVPFQDRSSVTMSHHL